MRKLTTAIALTTAAVALAAGTAGTATAAPASASAEHLSLYSWTLLNEHGPGPNPGERLTAQVSARTVGGHPRGHVVVQHVFEKSGTTRAEFDVDCLTVDGNGAITVTGPISQTVVTPLGGEPYLYQEGQHPEAGLTFYPTDEQHQRRVGWNHTNPQMHTEVVKCGPVPAGLWVIAGGTFLRR
ncbi:MULTISPECIES: hypothetical protein [Kitasatospora]|uniref:Allene oxide cyclase barrel-like domain-containing protein n=1 Tax=Kitasatospora cathayae TaxID=3004092 RepID=A0ABY7Q612_9ACTN|nr:hypothetical protein [Kitasatospora sp. HUAS 3-15]WBP88099.1 hypothetical protein O1G21_21210 [Kitasatospora sp. HUAS 3-15]